MKRLFICILLMYTAFSTFADWAPVSFKMDQHGILRPEITKSDKIKMENADIGISTWGFDHDLDFSCNFTFRNISDTKQNISMGYPVEFTITDEIKTAGIPSEYNPVKNFKVMSGNDEIKSTLSVKNTEHEIMYIVNLAIGPDETIEIKTSYKLQFDDYFINWKIIPPKNRIKYSLTRSALWAEKINRFNINVSISKMYPALLSMDTGNSPEMKESIDYVEDGIRFSGKYTDTEPEKDLNIEYESKSITQLLNTYLKSKDFDSIIPFIDTIYEWNKKYPDMTIGNADKDFLKNRFSMESIIDYDSLRNILYWTANSFYDSNFNKAEDYYKKAFFLSVGNLYRYQPDPDSLLTKDLSGWIFSDNSPSYFIAWNLACTNSLRGDINEAEKWARIAMRLNSQEITSYLKTDRDVANLRKNSTVYYDILYNEPAAITPTRQQVIEKTRMYYDLIKNSFEYNGEKPMTDGQLLDVIYAVPDEPLYAVIVYYKINRPGEFYVNGFKDYIHGSRSYAASGEVYYLKPGEGLLYIEIVPNNENEDMEPGLELYLEIYEPDTGDPIVTDHYPGLTTTEADRDFLHFLQ